MSDALRIERHTVVKVFSGETLLHEHTTSVAVGVFQEPSRVATLATKRLDDVQTPKAAGGYTAVARQLLQMPDTSEGRLKSLELLIARESGLECAEIAKKFKISRGEVHWRLGDAKKYCRSSKGQLAQVPGTPIIPASIMSRLNGGVHVNGHQSAES